MQTGRASSGKLQDRIGFSYQALISLIELDLVSVNQVGANSTYALNEQLLDVLQARRQIAPNRSTIAIDTLAWRLCDEFCGDAGTVHFGKECFP